MSHFQGNTGTLIIVVARARDLPNRRKMEKQNPYCLLRISNLTDKTKPDVRGGQYPRWDEEFRFNILPENQPILKFSILDETKKAPVLVSEAEIDFTPVFYSSVKEGFDKWHQLKAGHKEAGEVYLEMTFYPASSSLSSSYSKKPTKSLPTRKRDLPTLPGQELPQGPMSAPADAIPPPLPRAASPDALAFERLSRSQFGASQMNSSQQFYHSDSYRPDHTVDFSRSQMSVNSLPDIPRQNNIRKELPPIIADDERENPSNRGLPESSFNESLDPGRQRQTTDLKHFAKKLTSKYGKPLFGSRDDQSEKQTTDSFDELEREVQSDWIRNYRSEKPKPPPVPSHSVNSLSSGSLPPPPPQHSSGSLKNSSINQYNVIEPGQISPTGSPERRRSPERKAPTNFYKSGSSSPTRLNLSSLPYDANNIPSPTHNRPVIENYENRVTSSKDDEVLLDKHHAPTPYDMFVQNSAKDPQESFRRSSPTRFKSSLPPPPPPR